VLVPAGAGWPEGLSVGEAWLGGRLEVVGTWPKPGQEGMAPVTLCRVRPPR
jgi:hypothetical protein